MLRLLRNSLNKVIDRISREDITEETVEKVFDELEFELINANVAVDVIDEIRERLKEKVLGERVGRFSKKDFLRKALREIVSEILIEGDPEDLFRRLSEKKPVIILLMGINGVGKTLTCGKLANYIIKRGYSVVFSASDTFRAASIEQLEEIAKKIGVRVIKHKYGADPAAVAFDAIRFAEANGIDFVIIDSAGRMHTDRNLMEELKKIRRVSRPDFTMLVLDSLTGNDSVNQAKSFLEVGYDYIILTKFDLDEKGGTAISVSFVSKKPIIFLGMGQGLEDLKPFRKEEILRMVFGE